ncbi:DNA-binding transcriptional regulator BolA-like isoform X2 [Homalodisca vitripennis]|nr:DNA-binding transcriptional regulator BolA-like isoform X2 [Homalodisca vitripennis]
MICVAIFVHLLTTGWIYANPASERAIIIGMSNEDRGPVETSIRDKLMSRLRPMYLDVINQSIMYGERESDERYFTVIIVSSAFVGSNNYQRHLCVNGILEEEMATHIHALAIVAKTPDEWRIEHYATPAAEMAPENFSEVFPI